MRPKTLCICVRIPSELLTDLERAKEAVGAVSYSDLLRDALRHYLAGLSLLSERAERVKSLSRGEPSYEPPRRGS